jgi:hypothetical protein
MARRVFLYRLGITYPEGSQEPGWEPPGWREGLAVDLGRGQPDDDWRPGYCYDFRWPRRRTYLSRAAAERQARLLERCGAKVTVVQSLPVEWPEREP